MDALDAECPKCHGKATDKAAAPQAGAPKVAAPQAARPRTTPGQTRRGAVPFTHQSPDEIRAEAERRIKSGFTARGNAGTGQALKAGVLGLGLSFLSLRIPGLGPEHAAILSRVLAAGSALCMAGSGGMFLSSRLHKVSERDLEDATHRLRNMSKGHCPICDAEICLTPIERVATVECPACHGALYFSDDTVRAA